MSVNEEKKGEREIERERELEREIKIYPSSLSLSLNHKILFSCLSYANFVKFRKKKPHLHRR